MVSVLIADHRLTLIFPLYIAAYAVSLGQSPANGTITLAVFNLATAVGTPSFSHQPAHGFPDWPALKANNLSQDGTAMLGPYTRVIILSALLSSALTYVLWGFTYNLAHVFVFVASIVVLRLLYLHPDPFIAQSGGP